MGIPEKGTLIALPSQLNLNVMRMRRIKSVASAGRLSNFIVTELICRYYIPNLKDRDIVAAFCLCEEKRSPIRFRRLWQCSLHNRNKRLYLIASPAFSIGIK